MDKKEIFSLILELDSKNVMFSRLINICVGVFGPFRVSGSHYIFKMPWPGDPRINLQRGQGGFAKPYQVKQVRAALWEKFEGKD